MTGRLRRRIAIVTLAVVGLGLGSLGPASADDPPFADNWWNCNDTPGHVIYNPISGESIRVGSATAVPGPLEEPTWLWVCADTGGYGQASIGHALYIRPGIVPGPFTHNLVCLPVGEESCVQTWTGAEIRQPAAGAVGAQPCAYPVVDYDGECVSVGVTPSPTVPVTYSTSPANSNEICPVTDGGQCVTPRATVTTGGTVATAYVDATQVPVTVPSTCVGVNRPGLNPVVVELNSDGSC